ncbi:MAG: rhamnulokinase [Kiritimatiellae bacterium]|nr:rhamnulokinase [Kiritimatiellia bacterium]
MTYHLAIDIGASSGRHILGHLEDGKMVLEEVFRFDNSQIRKDGHDCWDHQALARSVLQGIAKCKEIGKIPATIGIDTWGVDFVLLDEQGLPCSDMVAYRDERTKGADALVDAAISADELYARCGIQKMLFNTIYQLAALKKEHPEQLEKAQRLLMVPEYLNFVLTGQMANEYTNATTGNLVNARAKDWDWEVIDRLGLPRRIFGKLEMPGTTLGGLTSAVQASVGIDAQVVLPATHDTGSAFLAVPARDDRAVYISSGTWSLLGVENAEPITTPEAKAANFTNEGGAWYRFRFLKNIMVLWMIQSIRRELKGVDYVEGKEKTASWSLADYEKGKKYSFADLENAAKAAHAFAGRVDANDTRFFSPDSMIAEVLAAADVKPATVGELMQCVYASLAACYAKMIRNLSGLTGKTYTSVNIVGGGSKDGYLNKLTAEATGLEVFAGPTEGTAIGNLIVQFIASGELADLAAARACVGRSFDVARV